MVHVAEYIFVYDVQNGPSLGLPNGNRGVMVDEVQRKCINVFSLRCRGWELDLPGFGKRSEYHDGGKQCLSERRAAPS